MRANLDGFTFPLHPPDVSKKLGHCLTGLPAESAQENIHCTVIHNEHLQFISEAQDTLFIFIFNKKCTSVSVKHTVHTGMYVHFRSAAEIRRHSRTG